MLPGVSLTRCVDSRRQKYRKPRAWVAFGLFSTSIDLQPPRRPPSSWGARVVDADAAHGEPLQMSRDCSAMREVGGGLGGGKRQQGNEGRMRWSGPEHASELARAARGGEGEVVKRLDVEKGASRRPALRRGIEGADDAPGVCAGCGIEAERLRRRAHGSRRPAGERAAATRLSLARAICCLSASATPGRAYSQVATPASLEAQWHLKLLLSSTGRRARRIGSPDRLAAAGVPCPSSSTHDLMRDKRATESVRATAQAGGVP